jgi:hypothetical protein
LDFDLVGPPMDDLALPGQFGERVAGTRRDYRDRQLNRRDGAFMLGWHVVVTSQEDRVGP